MKQRGPYPVRREWGIVVQAQALTRDMVRLRIALDGPALMFAPGQHADLAFEGWPARAYVLANRPGDPLLELHVQRVPGGMVSGHVVDEVREGARVQVRGPYGAGLLHAASGGPMLMMAGGWGLAAMKSVLLYALAGPARGRGTLHLYHGVRESRDLYDASILTDAGAGAVRYVPVVVTPSLETVCRHGFVHEAVESDFDTLSGFEVYVAGPPLMVDACIATALRLGARPEDVHADAFDVAPEEHAFMPQRAPKRGLIGTIFGF